MIKRASELNAPVFSNRFGGKGEIKMIQIIEQGDFHGKGRLFARVVIEPGSSLGLHRHDGDFEVYYILSGRGTVDDNGVLVEVGPGDVMYTDEGQSHSVENTGDTTLEMIALVLYA